MTDYPNRKAAWKRRDVQTKGRELLSIFIVVVLLLAILNGFLKTISFKKYLGKSNWDAKSSFVAALATKPPAIFVFQKEPKRIALFKLDPAKYYFSGDSQEPLVQLSKVIDDGDGRKLAKILAISTGADVENYAFLEDKDLDRETAEEIFKNFASPVAPFKILSGKDGSYMSTNISRRDLLSLWWQVKSLGINKLELVDLTGDSEVVVVGDNQKVLGVDEESLHFKIAPYLENRSLDKNRLNVLIENTTGVPAAASLASQFVTGVGFVATTINSADSSSFEATKIVAFDKEQYRVKYLAKIFDCDIVVAPKDSETGEIRVIVGTDFKDKYFK